MAVKKIAMRGTPIEEELYADATITPGQLLEVTATGVKRHATGGGQAYPMFALADTFLGNGIDDDYLVGVRTRVGTFPPGSHVWAFIADGEDIAIGDFLESNGNGDLREEVIDSVTTDVKTNSVVAVAREAIDLSGSAGADPDSRRCKVMIV